MNNTQRNRLDACHRFQVFNKKYADQLAGIPEYALEQKTFDDGLAVIETAAQVQVGTVGATANAAETAKQAMANTAVKYALRAAVKARQISNQVLATNLDHPITYLSKANKTLALSRAKDLKSSIYNNLPLLTNVTMANVDEIEAAIAYYESIKDTPIIERQTKSATGTSPIPVALATVLQAMANMYDLIVSYFNDTNPTMVNEAELAKQTIATGIRYSGVEGTITKAGQPVMGATVAVNGTDKTATTDSDGHYTIIKMKNTSHDFTVTYNDGSIQTKKATVTKGQMETVDFKQ